MSHSQYGVNHFDAFEQYNQDYNFPSYFKEIWMWNSSISNLHLLAKCYWTCDYNLYYEDLNSKNKQQHIVQYSENQNNNIFLAVINPSVVNIAFTVTPMSAPGSAALLTLFRLSGAHRCCPTWGFGFHPSLSTGSVCQCSSVL